MVVGGHQVSFIIRMLGGKEKAWKDSDMLTAMDKVEEGSTVSAAAKICGVPRRTLDDWVKGSVVSHGSLPGPRNDAYIHERVNKPKMRVFKSRALTEEEFYDTLMEKNRRKKRRNS